MKAANIAIAVLALSAAVVQAPASAFSLGNPLASLGGSSSSSANAGEVLRNTRDALVSFTKAEMGLSQALGGYADLTAQQQLVANMKTGDAAPKKEDFEALVAIHKTAKELIDKKTGENAALDASNKSLAGKSMVEYIKGVVHTKKIAGSVQDLAKNPMAMVGDATTLLYVAKEVPTITASAASSTGNLMKYLSSNGVDMAEANKEADTLGK